MTRQMSLFPDAFEVQAAALAAMRDLDVHRALDLVRQARRIDPHLPNLDLLEEVLLWLGHRLGELPAREGVTPESIAELLRALAAERAAGRLGEAGARFGDEVLAGYACRNHLAADDRPFLDEGHKVHRGMLDLILQRPQTAWKALRQTLAEGYGERADLWGYLGDACHELQRTPESDACYARALLLSAADLDLVRVRRRELAAIHEELAQAVPDAAARELLLPHAWLRGILEIPPDNHWLDEHLPRLLARAAPEAADDPERACRRFALLLYLDRSSPRGQVDLERRQEMAALDPPLFADYMAECRRREAGAARYPSN